MKFAELAKKLERIAVGFTPQEIDLFFTSEKDVPKDQYAAWEAVHKKQEAYFTGTIHPDKLIEMVALIHKGVLGVTKAAEGARKCLPVDDKRSEYSDYKKDAQQHATGLKTLLSELDKLCEAYLHETFK